MILYFLIIIPLHDFLEGKLFMCFIKFPWNSYGWSNNSYNLHKKGQWNPGMCLYMCVYITVPMFTYKWWKYEGVSLYVDLVSVFLGSGGGFWACSWLLLMFRFKIPLYVVGVLSLQGHSEALQSKGQKIMHINSAGRHQPILLPSKFSFCLEETDTGFVCVFVSLLLWGYWKREGDKKKSICRWTYKYQGGDHSFSWLSSRLGFGQRQDLEENICFNTCF